MAATTGSKTTSQMVLKTVELKSRKELAELQVKVKKNPAIRKMFPVKITSSRSAYEIVWELIDHDFLDIQETMMVLYLNRGNYFSGYKIISTGGTAGTVCDPKHVFSFGLGCMASSVILVHNHPSGNLTPSNADIELTKKCKNAAQYLDMSVLDHLIICSEEGKYYSLADNGNL